MTELTANPQTAKEPDYSVPVVIIGAGPAGMAAAKECASKGIKCLLLDEQSSKGGQIYRSITETSPQHQEILGDDYIAGKSLTLDSDHHLIDYSPNSTVWQVTRDKKVSFKRNSKSQTVQANNIILATGAMERPFPVPGWTLPGVLSCGGGQILLKSSGVVPSGKVVLAGCGPLLYLLAYQYINAGVKIDAIVDTSNFDDITSALPQLLKALRAANYLIKGLGMIRAIKKAKVPVYKGSTNISIDGQQTVTAINFRSKGRQYKLDADVVLLHQGVIPNTQISWSLRAEHEWDTQQLCWKPVTNEWGELDVDGIFVAGDGAAIGGALVAALEGAKTALEVCRLEGAIDVSQRNHQAAPIKAELKKHLAIRPFIDVTYQPKYENRVPTGNTIVCRCESVTASDIESYVDHGCRGPNQAKAFGRCGMGPCQGRQCGTTVTELIASKLKESADTVGYYRIRPPIKPITLAELAGDD